MTNNKRFRTEKVIAGVVCLGFAFWLLVVALIADSTPVVIRFTSLAGASVFLWAAVQGLNKQ
jgi:threonine/homoserine/homoserine lactone efflux protein